MEATRTQQRPQLLIAPFPVPGQLVQFAYRELNLAMNGSDEQKKQIGNPSLLPHPWEPATCLDAELRRQVWRWLEEVVVWLNREYSWDVAGMIPTCWPAHSHLVHEVAVVADQRRRAGLAMTSDALEEWHRYCLPAFTERMRNRLKAHCDDEHVAWPGRSRHSQHTSDGDSEDRDGLYIADVNALRGTGASHEPRQASPRLGLVDLETGEIKTEFSNTDDPSKPED